MGDPDGGLISFRDTDGLRHSWPRNQVGVSEILNAPTLRSQDRVDPQACVVRFGVTVVRVRMSYPVFRRLLAGQKSQKMPV